ncbi:DUF3040 domain-containing protein [Nakamurella sp.]|uniref:DUF3040 domain-containing protein n=1 Tax=Nakamurella sp. TaxID=1869182 RepID=UPI003784B1F8
MPLSNDERQKLAEIERELTRADPELARTIASGRFPLLVPLLYAAAFVAAAAVLVGGLVTTHAFPITGAIVAVAGATLMAWSARRLLREVRGVLPADPTAPGRSRRP